MRRSRTRQVGERRELATGHVRDAAVNAAKTTPRTEIRDALPTGLDRAPAQLLRRRRGRQREPRRGAGQATQPETRAQQVVAVAMRGDAYVAEGVVCGHATFPEDERYRATMRQGNRRWQAVVG